MVKKVAMFLVFLLSSVTCSSHNSTVFLNNPHRFSYGHKLCDPERSFPQMVLIPYFVEATQVVPDCDTYPSHQVALSLFIFYHHWLESFGDENLAVRGMLERVMVRWGKEKRRSSAGYDLHGNRNSSGVIIGIVESKSAVWVWEGYHHKISESALFHELTHLALRAINGKHGDPDHEGYKYFGWTPAHSRMIIQCKRVLRSFEL